MNTELLQQSAVLHKSADVIELRLIKGKLAHSRFCLASELPTLIDALHAENADGWNIYIGIAPRIAHGRRGDDAVAFHRTLFADADHTTPEEFTSRRAGVGMPSPTLMNWSGNGVHAYWLLRHTLAAKWWKEWQQDLAALLGTDGTVFNPERVARATGFDNVKAEPKPCYILDCDPSRVYDLADLPIGMREGSDTPTPLFTVKRVIDPSEAGDPFERCRAYLLKCPDAVSGSKGHRTTWHAANTCNRFGLSESEAIDLMGWYSAAKCDPPWSEHEIQHKVRDAYRRNAHQHGSKLCERREPLFTVRRVRGAA